MHGRLIAGVASGVADYLDVDVVLVRTLFVVLALVGGIGVPLYVAAWLLMPDENRDESIAEQLLCCTRRAYGSGSSSGEPSETDERRHRVTTS